MAFATSAVRDATNCDEVLAQVADKTGVTVDVLSGTDEARLTSLPSGAGTGGAPDASWPSTSGWRFAPDVPTASTRNRTWRCRCHWVRQAHPRVAARRPAGPPADLCAA